jgi:hypothetical protein
MHLWQAWDILALSVKLPFNIVCFIRKSLIAFFVTYVSYDRDLQSSRFIDSSG